MKVEKQRSDLGGADGTFSKGLTPNPGENHDNVTEIQAHSQVFHQRLVAYTDALAVPHYPPLEDAKQTFHESFDQMKQKLFKLELEEFAGNLAGVKTLGT